MKKSPTRKQLARPVSLLLIISLLATSSPIALAGGASCDKLAPPSEVKRYAEEGARRQWAPQSFWDQVGFLEAIGTYRQRSFAMYRHFFALSRLFSDGVLQSLSEEAKPKPSGIQLAKLTYYLYQSLKGKKSWEEIKPENYTCKTENPGSEQMVAEALKDLGWEFTRVSGRAMIARKGEFVAVDTAKVEAPSAQSAVSPPVTETITAVASLSTSKEIAVSQQRPPAVQDSKSLRHQAFGEVLRDLCNDGRYQEAARLLVLGSATPQDAREAGQVLRDQLSFVQTAQVIRLLPNDAAAYLLAVAAAIGEKSIIFRDVTSPFTAKPKINNAGVIWACEVLRYVDHLLEGADASAKTSRACEIVGQIVLCKRIPFGPDVAVVIIEHARTRSDDADLRNLGSRLLQTVGRIRAGQDKGLTRKPISMTTRQDLVTHLSGLFDGGFVPSAPVKNAPENAVLDVRKAKEAAQIVFLKLDPLSAYGVLNDVSIHVVTVDEDLVYLLPQVPAPFVARFFVEVNAAAETTDKERVFEWTMDRLADLQRRGVAQGQKATAHAKQIMQAMLLDEFAGKGGRELFRKILDPKTTHKDYGVVLQLYEALYRDDSNMVDWFTFFKTGKLYATELTPEETLHSVTDWAEDFFMLPPNQIGAERALERLEKITRLKDRRIIPYLISVVNRRCQMWAAKDWGMDQSRFDAFNARFLRVALELDPQTFAQAYWTHRGNVPELRTGFFAMLRSLQGSLGPEPRWEDNVMNRLLLKCLSPEEQTDLVLRGIKYSEDPVHSAINERIAQFIQYGLTQEGSNLDARVVAAAALMHSGRCLMELRPPVSMSKLCARLAGLYRCRAVAAHVDHYLADSNCLPRALLHGEYVDMEIALGSASFWDLMERINANLGFNLWPEGYKTIQDVALASKFRPDVEIRRFLHQHIDSSHEWHEMLRHTKPRSNERKVAMFEFLASLPIEVSEWSKHGGMYTRQILKKTSIPLLAEYAAVIDAQNAEDLYVAAIHVANALGDKPPETTVTMKELAIQYEKTKALLAKSPDYLPSETKRELWFSSSEKAKESREMLPPDLKTFFALDDSRGVHMRGLLEALSLMPLRLPLRNFIILLLPVNLILSIWPLIMIFEHMMGWPGWVFLPTTLVGGVLVIIAGEKKEKATLGAIGSLIFLSPVLIPVAILALLSVLVIPIEQLLLTPVAWIIFLATGGIHFIGHKYGNLPLLRSELRQTLDSMRNLLPQLEFDPVKPLEEQIPVPLLESAQKRLKGSLDVVSEVDEKNLSILDNCISNLKDSSNPMDRALLSYANARKIYLTKQLPGSTAPAILTLGAAPAYDVSRADDLAQTSI